MVLISFSSHFYLIRFFKQITIWNEYFLYSPFKFAFEIYSPLAQVHLYKLFPLWNLQKSSNLITKTRHSISTKLRGVEIKKAKKPFSPLRCAKYDKIDRSCCIISVQDSFFFRKNWCICHILKLSWNWEFEFWWLKIA